MAQAGPEDGDVVGHAPKDKVQPQLSVVRRPSAIMLLDQAEPVFQFQLFIAFPVMR
jgi:hypothetical protein